MSKTKGDPFIDLISTLINECYKHLNDKSLTSDHTSDHNIDFFIKKGTCLSSFKDIYLEYKKKNKDVTQIELSNYLSKVNNIFNDWINLLRDTRITKGLQKCIPGSSSTFANIDKIEIMGKNNIWKNLGNEEFRIKVETPIDIEEVSPVVLFDTGGFGSTLITGNLVSQLELKFTFTLADPTKEKSVDICATKIKIIGFVNIKWRFTYDEEKIYEIKANVVVSIGDLFGYGILFADDFFRKYKSFSIRQDLEPNNAETIRQATARFNYHNTNDKFLVDLRFHHFQFF